MSARFERPGLADSNVIKQKDREGFHQPDVRSRRRDTLIKPHGDRAIAPWEANEVW